MFTRPTLTKSGALFAAALLTGSGATALAGPEAKAIADKTVVAPAPANPLCFFNETLCLDLQERVRFEVRDNNFDFNDGDSALADDTFLLQRFRLGLLWKPASWLKFYAQGQDSREIDSARPNIPGALAAEGDDNFDLRQAWVEVGPFADVPLSLKVGRQVLTYGDERLIGGFEWNNFARTFDAAKLVYKHPKFQVDLFTSSPVTIRRDSFNVSDVFNGYEDDRQLTFSGLYATTGAVPWGTAEAYALLLTEKNGNTSNLEGLRNVNPAPGSLAEHSTFGTYGGRLKGDPKKLRGWEFEVEGAYQNGEVRDLALNAFAVHGGLGYNFDVPLKPRLWAEYNFASGDSDRFDNDLGTFQNLFPTNHKFYGYMDLFSWQNLHNPMASVRFTPAKPVTVQLDYHAFWLDTNEDLAYRANGISTLRPGSAPNSRTADTFVGQEVDLTVTWRVAKYLQVQAGYSHFFAGQYLDDTRTSGTEADDADFGYVMATLSF